MNDAAAVFIPRPTLYYNHGAGNYHHHHQQQQHISRLAVFTVVWMVCIIGAILPSRRCGAVLAFSSSPKNTNTNNNNKQSFRLYAAERNDNDNPFSSFWKSLGFQDFTATENNKEQEKKQSETRTEKSSPPSSFEQDFLASSLSSDDYYNYNKIGRNERVAANGKKIQDEKDNFYSLFQNDNMNLQQQQQQQKQQPPDEMKSRPSILFQEVPFAPRNISNNKDNKSQSSNNNRQQQQQTIPNYQSSASSLSNGQTQPDNKDFIQGNTIPYFVVDDDEDDDNEDDIIEVAIMASSLPPQPPISNGKLDSRQNEPDQRAPATPPPPVSSSRNRSVPKNKVPMEYVPFRRPQTKPEVASEILEDRFNDINKDKMENDAGSYQTQKKRATSVNTKGNTRRQQQQQPQQQQQQQNRYLSYYLIMENLKKQQRRRRQQQTRSPPPPFVKQASIPPPQQQPAARPSPSDFDRTRQDDAFVAKTKTKTSAAEPYKQPQQRQQKYPQQQWQWEEEILFSDDDDFNVGSKPPPRVRTINDPSSSSSPRSQPSPFPEFLRPISNEQQTQDTPAYASGQPSSSSRTAAAATTAEGRQQMLDKEAILKNKRMAGPSSPWYTPPPVSPPTPPPPPGAAATSSAPVTRNLVDLSAKTRLANGITEQEVTIFGGCLKTWTFRSRSISRVQLIVRTMEGRPLNVDVDLCQGPDDHVPVRFRYYADNAQNERPLNVILETPGVENALAIRNNNPPQNNNNRNVEEEFPIQATVEAELDISDTEGTAGFKDTQQALMDACIPKLVQGNGAVLTKTFGPHVESVQVQLRTDGRPLCARLELLQGTDDDNNNANNKQVLDVYTEHGGKFPFFTIMETPPPHLAADKYGGMNQGSNGYPTPRHYHVVRIVNTAPLEFPLYATVEPYVVSTDSQPDDDDDDDDDPLLDVSGGDDVELIR